LAEQSRLMIVNYDIAALADATARCITSGFVVG
jgi:hypothetical protein